MPDPAAAPGDAPMTEPRVVVSHEGPGEPIKLTLYSDGAEVAVELTPVRALELAQQLTQPAVTAIKTSQWGPGWPG